MLEGERRRLLEADVVPLLGGRRGGDLAGDLTHLSYMCTDRYTIIHTDR